MDKLEGINKNWKTITAAFAAVIAIFMFCHNLLNKYDEIIATNRLTLQMALKSIIWNENIPDIERESACDAYLKNGWNSYTKKECQIILDNSGKFKEENN